MSKNNISLKNTSEIEVKCRYVRMTLDNAIHYDDALLEVPVLKGLRKEYDEALVDPSYYVSSVERAKEAKKSSGEINKACYDYPDGKVVGDSEKLARVRKPGLDIVELSEMADEAYKESQESLYLDVENAKKRESKRRQDTDTYLQGQIKNVVNGSVNTSEKTSNN